MLYYKKFFNELPRSRTARYQYIKDFVSDCHSALDAESSSSLFLDSCFRRNDVMYTETPKQSFEEFFLLKGELE